MSELKLLFFGTKLYLHIANEGDSPSLDNKAQHQKEKQKQRQ